MEAFGWRGTRLLSGFTSFTFPPTSYIWANSVSLHVNLWTIWISPVCLGKFSILSLSGTSLFRSIQNGSLHAGPANCNIQAILGAKKVAIENGCLAAFSLVSGTSPQSMPTRTVDSYSCIVIRRIVGGGCTGKGNCKWWEMVHTIQGSCQLISCQLFNWSTALIIWTKLWSRCAQWNDKKSCFLSPIVIFWAKN